MARLAYQKNCNWISLYRLHELAWSVASSCEQVAVVGVGGRGGGGGGRNTQTCRAVRPKVKLNLN